MISSYLADGLINKRGICLFSFLSFVSFLNSPIFDFFLLFLMSILKRTWVGNINGVARWGKDMLSVNWVSLLYVGGGGGGGGGGWLGWSSTLFFHHYTYTYCNYYILSLFYWYGCCDLRQSENICFSAACLLMLHSFGVS